MNLVELVLPELDEIVNQLKCIYKFKKVAKCGCRVKTILMEPDIYTASGTIIWHWVQEDFGKPEDKISMVDFVYRAGYSVFDEKVEIEFSNCVGLESVEYGRELIGKTVELIE